MGNKVDYRPKKNKKIIKYLKIAGIVIVALIIVYFLIQSILRAYRTTITPDSSNSNLHYDLNEYDSLEELLSAYGCVYISEVSTSDLLKITVKFDRDLYTDETSNENYFLAIINVVAEYENYKNFELIDESRNIDIVVTCENSSIVQIQINGDENYYLNQDSLINSRKESAKVTDFSIDSSELTLLINNGWNPSNLNLGTKDSSCNGYEIYFDEGFKYKISGRTVYNLVFTDKYTNSIVSGLNASSTAEEIEETLGEPTFSYNSTLYGYIGENNYVFFDFTNKQVSIYPVVALENENEFIELINQMNEDSDIRQFSMDLISLWTDYDIYDYDSNYVDLQYTLRGIELTISSRSLKNGIYIYQNYRGDINSISSIDNVYIQDTDLVFEEEKERSLYATVCRTEQGEDIEALYEMYGQIFAVRFVGELISNEEGYKGPVFYSRNEEYPDTELERTLVISSWAWYDDYNFIYSVDNDGIYLFNPVSNFNTKITDISGEIQINSAGDGKIVYNDTEQINISIEE